MPARVHTKLLVAFVGTALLVVAVGVLGLRLLGQSNNRVVTLGGLQERAAAYGKLRSDAFHVRLLLTENVGAAYFTPLTGQAADRGEGARAIDKAVADTVARRAIDLAVVDAVGRIAPSTFPDL